ncbi:MAG: hypothetical protein ACJA1B_002491 [Polaribacter sp.]|jgi:hypothetical protein
MLKKLLLSFLLLSVSLFSQEKKTLLNGKLIDTLGAIKNANIINLNSKLGTSSSDIGTFKIYVSLGDSLKISSIQHQTMFLKINNSNYDNKIILIPLLLKTYSLDSFDLKRHNLTGRLTIDSKAVPKDKKDSILKNNMDFSNVNFNHIDLRIDENNRAMPAVTITDPNSKFEGINIISFFKSRKAKKLKREAKKQKKIYDLEDFPNKIMIELGETFFFKDLKIPEENFQHFLEYCNILTLERLYQKGKLLEVIQILQDESVNYLKIIKKENKN